MSIALVGISKPKKKKDEQIIMTLCFLRDKMKKIKSGLDNLKEIYQ